MVWTIWKAPVGLTGAFLHPNRLCVNIDDNRNSSANNLDWNLPFQIPNQQMTEPQFFKTPLALQKWFARYADSRDQLHVGYYKKATGIPSITWPESVDEALCVGWIDGIRHRIDEISYRIRFTPRRKNSHWSAVNISRVKVLKKEGRMQPSGLAAFERRTQAKSKLAGYEQPKNIRLSTPHLETLEQDTAAHEFFLSLPAGYRKTVTWWVISAKRADTRERRFQKLLEACRQKKRNF